MTSPDLTPIAPLVLDALDVGIIVLDLDRRIVAWNEWIASRSGIAATAAAGRQIEELFADLRLSRLPDAIVDALDNGASSVLNNTLTPSILTLKTPTGRVLLHNLTVKPMAWNGRDYCLVQVNDVTASIERERVLRARQNARYRAVVDTALDGVITTSDDGIVQWLNRAAEQQFGYTAQEAVGLDIAQFLGSNSGWLMNGDEEQAAATVEVTGRRKDGSITYIELSRVRWESEGRYFYTGILRDINERRHNQELLLRLNETLEQRVAERTLERDLVWRVSRDLFCICGRDGRYLSVNPAWTDALGFGIDELIGQRFDMLIHPDDVQYVTGMSEGMLADGTILSDQDLRIRLKDGSYRWFNWDCFNADHAFYAAGRDVTDRKALEEQLRQSQKMEAVGQLTGGIAHDFNNLLAGIMGSLELIQIRVGQGRVAETEKYLKAAMGSAQRAGALTHRLLAFSRRQTLDPKPVDLNRLVASLDDLIQRTAGPGIVTQTRLAQDLGAVLCDPNQLENALLNLAINARDAMADGGTLTITTDNVELTAAYAATQSDVRAGPYVCLSVADTGTGMPADVIARAFDPFFTTKPLGKGTGLGLSMIYGFVKQSAGHTRIHSEIGVGTTVSLYFPLYKGRPSVEPTRSQPPVMRVDANKTVLVVEDETVVRMLLTEAMESLGHRVIDAQDANTALKQLADQTDIDLLITDIGLPGGMNGRQLARAVRETLPAIKVLFVTGYDVDTAGENESLDPTTQMLVKPFARDDLLRKVSEMLV